MASSPSSSQLLATRPAADQWRPPPWEGARALECRNVSKSFGGVKALDSVSMHVAPGTVTALIGPNGAGKTTLFNCMSGFDRPNAGEVLLADRRIDAMPPHRVARLGLVRTFQSIRMFADMTVLESVLAAQTIAGRGAERGVSLRLIRRRSDLVAEAVQTLEAFSLDRVMNARCADLPLLAQRRVEVARAAATRPRLMLLDEPTAGATHHEAAELAGMIHVLRDRGMTVLVIEHNVPFVMDIASTVWVLNFGKIVAHGSPEHVRNNEIVKEIYLGG